MLEVVFNDSVQGSMKAAKNYNRRSNISAFGIIGEAAEELKSWTEEQVLDYMKENGLLKPEGKGLEGSSNEVVCLPLNFDIGDISGDTLDLPRLDLIYEMTKNPFEEEEQNHIHFKESWDRIRDNYNRILDSAQKGEKIRIWWSDAPYSACGYYHLNTILEQYECQVTAIKLPRYMELDNNTVQTYTSWGEIDSGMFYRFLPFERELGKMERFAISNEWRDLKNENTVLRAVIKGKLKSVPEDFYDYFIRENIPDGEIKLARIIGNIINKTGFGVSDWWYAKRIERMIKNKELIMIQDNKFFYEKIIKKSTPNRF